MVEEISRILGSMHESWAVFSRSLAIRISEVAVNDGLAGGFLPPVATLWDERTARAPRCLSLPHDRGPVGPNSVSAVSVVEPIKHPPKLLCPPRTP